MQDGFPGTCNASNQLGWTEGASVAHAMKWRVGRIVALQHTSIDVFAYGETVSHPMVLRIRG